MATEAIPGPSPGQTGGRPGEGRPGEGRPGKEEPHLTPFQRGVTRIDRRTMGWVLTGVGLLAIVLGWFGVSGQALVAKQLPYLVSGGILGVALVSLGAFILGTEDMRRDSGRLDRLERMVLELHAVLLARADAPERSLLERIDLTAGDGAPGGASAPGGGAPRSAAPDDGLVALPEGQTYHRASCAMISGKTQAATVTPGSARRRGLKPCRLCEPAPVAG